MSNKIYLLAGLLFVAGANAQTIPLSETLLRGYFDAASPSDRADARDQLVAWNKAYTAYLNYVQETRQAQAKERLKGRNEKELGATAQPQGATGLVSVAGVPDIISTAVESGALTQTGTGTATTVRVTPLAIYNIFTGRDQTPCSMYHVLTGVRKADGNVENCGTSLDRYLGGLSASVTLDNAKPDQAQAQPTAAVNSSGQTTAVTASNGSVINILTQGRSVTSWGVRWQLYNERSTRSHGFIKAFNTATAAASLGPKAEALATLVNNPDIPKDPDFQAWQKATQQRIDATRLLGWEALEQVWKEQLAILGSLKTFLANKDLQAYDTARKAFIAEENKVFDAELNKPIISLEYNNNRPLNQPDLSNVKLLISKAYQVQNTQEAMFSFNAAADLYDTIPTGAKVGHLRDVSAALQWDIPIRPLKAGIPTTFTLAGYYQYQIENGLISVGTGNFAPNTTIELPSDAKTLLTPKGAIFIGQAKLTFKMKDGTSKVPLGISWANRTELIKASEVRGHIGLQFDWSTLFGSGS